ncbi:MAG: ribonuclease H family protein, partial [Bacteroidales bacterium]|nr:ribonuclease H family protein [Bacteroidales bacterium]
MASRKWYVVWVGTEPGVCETWEECYIRTHGFPGARYKAYDSSRDAIEAYRKGLDEANDPRAVIRAIAEAQTPTTNYAAIKEIYPGSVAVCGVCDRATGMMQYRGVDIFSGEELFSFGPIAGSDNAAEYLAIVHALALLKSQKKDRTAIYCTSAIALAWVRAKKSSMHIPPTQAHAKMAQLLARADHWLATNEFHNFVIKWKTDQWGETPAAFPKE